MLHRYRYHWTLWLYFLADDKNSNKFILVMQWEDSAYWFWRLLWSFNEPGEVSREGKLLCSKVFQNLYVLSSRKLIAFVTNFYVQVPFRLTRMLVKAMEVSGIEGNFRSTCENVMQVLRLHKDSVMAMMEVNFWHHILPCKIYFSWSEWDHTIMAWILIGLYWTPFSCTLMGCFLVQKDLKSRLCYLLKSTNGWYKSVLSNSSRFGSNWSWNGLNDWKIRICQSLNCHVEQLKALIKTTK